MHVPTSKGILVPPPGEKHAALHNGQGEGGEGNTSAQARRPLNPLLVASSCLLLLLTTAYFDNIYGESSGRGGLWAVGLADSIQTKARQREAICSLIFQYDLRLFAGPSYGMGRGEEGTKGCQEKEGRREEEKETRGKWKGGTKGHGTPGCSRRESKGHEGLVCVCVCV